MKVISAIYAAEGDDGRTRRVVFLSAEGEATWVSNDYKFPRPGWPVVPLFARFEMPIVKMSGVDPDGRKLTLDFSYSTTDPIVVNLVMQAIEDLDNGTFINGRQVWPI
jgi:hypothetical protein